MSKKQKLLLVRLAEAVNRILSNQYDKDQLHDRSGADIQWDLRVAMKAVEREQ